MQGTSQNIPWQNPATKGCSNTPFSLGSCKLSFESREILLSFVYIFVSACSASVPLRRWLKSPKRSSKHQDPLLMLVHGKVALVFTNHMGFLWSPPHFSIRLYVLLRTILGGEPAPRSYFSRCFSYKGETKRGTLYPAVWVQWSFHEWLHTHFFLQVRDTFLALDTVSVPTCF